MHTHRVDGWPAGLDGSGSYGAAWPSRTSTAFLRVW